MSCKYAWVEEWENVYSAGKILYQPIYLSIDINIIYLSMNI